MVFFFWLSPERLGIPLEICVVVGLDYGFSFLFLSNEIPSKVDKVKCYSFVSVQNYNIFLAMHFKEIRSKHVHFKISNSLTPQIFCLSVKLWI